MKTAVVGVTGLVLGLAIGLFATLGVRSQEGFVVRPKTACLTPEGFTFKIDYVGRGTAYFKVLPPETPSTKEKK